jgi:hypothetical protein
MPDSLLTEKGSQIIKFVSDTHNLLVKKRSMPLVFTKEENRYLNELIDTLNYLGENLKNDIRQPFSDRS